MRRMNLCDRASPKDRLVIVFNSFLVNYVAIFFVIVDYFVYCLGPFYVNTNEGYFYA